MIYDEDLAAHHDAHHGVIAVEGARTVLRELAAAGWRHGTVVDVGCGSGITAERLLAGGFDVVGVEPSPAMRALAARRAPGAVLQDATVASMDLPDGLVGIAALGEVLSYDLDIDLDEVLERFHAALRPGGVLVLDVAGPGRHDHDSGPTRAWDRGRSFLVVNASTARMRLTREMTLFTDAGRGRWRRHDETHEMRLHPAQDVRSGLARAGFVAIRALPRYGDAEVDFGEHWPAFVAARP